MAKIPIIVFVAISCLIATEPLVAEEMGTVISVTGRARYRDIKIDQWQLLQSGQKLDKGVLIRTDEGASLRILNADGSMKFISGTREVVYGKTDDHVGGEKSNLKTVLRELFGSWNRRRIAADRDFATVQQDWLRFLEQGKIPPEDLELGFELMAFYEEFGKTNRVMALLSKLTEQYPNSQGIQQLWRQERPGYHSGIQWQAYKIVSGRKVKIKPNSRLVKGDKVQIRYKSSAESYYYLFLTTHRQNGSVETDMVFPDELSALRQVNRSAYFQSRLKSEEELHLPSTNTAFILDKNKGMEHLWGWSCFGPVLDHKLVTRIIHRTEAMLKEQPVLTTNRVSQIKPAICHAAFALSFQHR